MVFDLVTTVERVERQEDGSHIAEIGLEQGVLMPMKIQETRARGRAMLATGFVEAAGARASDIAKAIKNLDFDTIKRNTEVLDTSKDDSGRTIIEVKVN